MKNILVNLEHRIVVWQHDKEWTATKVEENMVETKNVSHASTFNEVTENIKMQMDEFTIVYPKEEKDKDWSNLFNLAVKTICERNLYKYQLPLYRANVKEGRYRILYSGGITDRSFNFRDELEIQSKELERFRFPTSYDAELMIRELKRVNDLAWFTIVKVIKKL